MDDIQFNGGLFDAVGLSDAAKAKNRSEPQVAARAPLVVPPSLDRLPQPGSEEAAEKTAIAGIKDHDAAKQASKEELKRQQAEYCDVNYEQAKARGEEVDFVEGPLGPCRKSVLTAIKKWNESDE
jgi:flagellar biosynthesis/type III secretory pathway protein FliH